MQTIGTHKGWHRVLGLLVSRTEGRLVRNCHRGTFREFALARHPCSVFCTPGVIVCHPPSNSHGVWSTPEIAPRLVCQSDSHWVLCAYKPKRERLALCIKWYLLGNPRKLAYETAGWGLERGFVQESFKTAPPSCNLRFRWYITGESDTLVSDSVQVCLQSLFWKGCIYQNAVFPKPSCFMHMPPLVAHVHEMNTIEAVKYQGQNNVPGAAQGTVWKSTFLSGFRLGELHFYEAGWLL